VKKGFQRKKKKHPRGIHSSQSKARKEGEDNHVLEKVEVSSFWELVTLEEIKKMRRKLGTVIL